jgi:hypothetical protein
LPQKRAFADSTIKIQESSSSDSDSEVSVAKQIEATPGDTKIVLNLFDEDESIPQPPLKKKKVEEKKPQVVATPEPFFKS